MLPQNLTIRDLDLSQASISAHLHLPNMSSLVRGIMHRAAWGTESTGERGDEEKKNKRLFCLASDLLSILRSKSWQEQVLLLCDR